MRIEKTVRIDAPIEHIWSALTDVTRWPEWTASTGSVARLEASPFGIGSRTRIKQPNLRAMTWTVTAFEPPRTFTWEARAPGVVLSATHELHGDGSGKVGVSLTLVQEGIVGRALGTFTSKRTSRYVEMEAQGLKARAESGR